MKSIKYSKYTGLDWDSLSLEELLNKLSDFLLQSGFYQDYYGLNELGQDHNLQNLHDAIMDALLNQDMLSDELLEKLLEGSPEDQEERLSQLVQKLIDRLREEGYLNYSDGPAAADGNPAQGSAHEDAEVGEVRFELTNKSLDFRGYKTLKDLLGSLGRSWAGGKKDLRRT